MTFSSKDEGQITLYTKSRGSQLENRVEIDTLANKIVDNL